MVLREGPVRVGGAGAQALRFRAVWDCGLPVCNWRLLVYAAHLRSCQLWASPGGEGLCVAVPAAGVRLLPSHAGNFLVAF